MKGEKKSRQNNKELNNNGKNTKQIVSLIWNRLAFYQREVG
jgi:hypothetical protein